MKAGNLDVTVYPIDLPYDPYRASLAEGERIVAGQDVWVTNEPKIRKRPGTATGEFDGYAFPANHRVDRLWIYRTIEASPKVYVLASAYDTVNAWWEMFYIRLGAGTPAWTGLGGLRDIDESTRPHEVVVFRGLAYIVGYPGSSADKYGTVIFDGTSATTHFWGAPAPTVGANPSASSGWSASTNNQTVNHGWTYAYSWVTTTGHVSARSPIIAPLGQGLASDSDTGAFTNKIPTVGVTGNADTTNLPTIRLFRTSDGGSSMATVRDGITNTGSGTIFTTDNQGASGDPVPDFAVNFAAFAPGEFTNLPPPRVVAPQVTGTNAVIDSTAPVVWSDRLWYGLRNKLVFSGNEEILQGKPPEAFPGGTTGDYTVDGNFVDFASDIRQLIPTEDGLYVVTTDGVYIITGTLRASFRVEPFDPRIGGVTYKQASDSQGNAAVWMTRGGRIAVVQGRQLLRPYVSEEVYDELKSALDAADDVWVKIHQQGQHSWVVVGFVDRDTPANSKLYVYDTVRQKWNTPWVIPFTAMVSGVPKEGTDNEQLVMATWTGSQAYVGLLDLTATSDNLWSSEQSYQPTFTLNLGMVPAGHFVNLRTVPVATPRLDYVLVEREIFSGDSDPTVAYRFDDNTGSFTNITLVDPPYRTQGTGIKSQWAALGKACGRVQVKVTAANDTRDFKVQALGLVWNPPARV